MQFPFLSMLVMDDWLQGVPGAWAMLSNEQEPTLMTFFDAVKGRVESLKPDWRPSCFIIDDCQAFANALRCGTLYSTWQFTATCWETARTLVFVLRTLVL
eukprot:GHUV01033332.1.p1 GENE.GHUV01033332.1~~GHUV01033332.1.p1  ORF type:complete len:100 (-),score=13.81 GHUV01033332.1:284-583(-)